MTTKHKHKYSTLACGCVMCKCGHIKKGCYNHPIENPKPAKEDWIKRFDEEFTSKDPITRELYIDMKGGGYVKRIKQFIKDLLSEQRGEIEKKKLVAFNSRIVKDVGLMRDLKKMWLEQIIKEIEGMKKKSNPPDAEIKYRTINWYNQALSEVISKLKNVKE